MKGRDVMPGPSELSEARRALLQKYLGRDLSQNAKNESVMPPRSTKTEVVGERERTIAIQTGSATKLPFFFLHGQWQDSAFFCYPLARSLGVEQPFYIPEPYKFDGMRLPPTLAEVAAAHLQSLRTIQPEGPYMLGGWCNGA
jgi:hypothetical protein